jgi:hypothetical protein
MVCVRYWPKADICSAPQMSAFGGKADIDHCSANAGTLSNLS